MNIRSVFLAGLLCVTSIGYSQENKCYYLNAVFIIDGEISKVHEGMIITSNSVNGSTDTIKFTNHNIGTINFTKESFDKFMSLNPMQEVQLRFTYVSPSPNYKQFIYKETIDAKWLNHGFIILNVYNYSNKKNWKEFEQRKGYGIEWQASERFKIIPRKAKIK